MALLETLIIGVGAGIAKGIFRIWLRHDPVAQSVGEAIVNVVKKKTDDTLAQRSAQRQFDRISEEAAQAVMRVFDLEAAGMAEDRRQLVADAAGRTVKTAEVSAELLARRNLGPADLTDFFLEAAAGEGGNPCEGFTAAETDLYGRILSQSAQYIVDIGSQMPQFTERTFAEVLRREEHLIGLAQQIFAEVEKIRAGLETGDVAAARFEEDYRRAVIRRLDELELFGVDLSGSAKRYRLSVAYVTLLVERSGPAEQSDDDESDYSELLPVDRALATSPRLLIRGQAGSGKTTLLRWVAVGAAARKFKGHLQPFNGWTPLMVRLREFAHAELPKPEDLIERIAPNIAGTMPAGWVRQRLKSGRALVLIDGVDEVPQARRKDVRRWVAELVTTFGQARFVVTSRPYAADEGWLADQHFVDAELQDMAGDDLDEFIEHWHAALAEGLQRQEDKDDLVGLEANLKRVLHKNRPLRRLATNPLLCALLCALHRERVKQLPSDRILLYRDCCEMFLRREAERGVWLPEYPKIGNREALALLEDFAYWMITNELSQVEVARVDKRLGRKVRALQNIPAGTEGSDVRRLFVESCGILQEPSPEMVNFPHRAFQEYLAASAAVEQDDLEQLANNAHDAQWHELVILAAGRARPGEANRLVEELIARGDADKAVCHSLYLVAVGCLETMMQPRPEVEQLVEDRVRKILPPKSMTEAKALASVGEIVVAHLSYDPKMKAEHAAASLRTLALIGGDLAHQAAGQYAEDSRQTVQRTLTATLQCAADPPGFATALAECFTSFNFARQNLAEVPAVLLDVPQLVRCNLSDNPISDVSPLAGLTGLQSLGLSGTKVSDLSPLAGLTGLQALNVSHTQVSDLSPLARLTGLQALDLRYTQVSDLLPLAGLTRLQTIYLNDTQVSSLSPLAGLRGLQTLHLDMRQVSQPSALGGLTSPPPGAIGQPHVAAIEFVLEQSLQQFDSEKFNSVLFDGTGVSASAVRIVSIRLGSTIVRMEGEFAALERMAEVLRESQALVERLATHFDLTHVSFAIQRIECQLVVTLRVDASGGPPPGPPDPPTVPEPRVPAVSKCKILLFAACPQKTKQLALDKEVREIETKIHMADYRDNLQLISKWAVRPDDLLQGLNQHRPHVVQFSGHGLPYQGILLLDANDQPKLVSKAAIERLFRTMAGNIRLVVLSACYSELQARAIIAHIDCAIGMGWNISDRAAITFAASLYRAIGFGRSVENAFEQGCTALMLEGIGEEQMPQLLARDGVDPDQIFLVRPE